VTLLKDFWFGCGHCHGEKECPLIQASEQASGPGGEFVRGRGLVISAIVVFILPMMTAILGAWLASNWGAQANFASLGRWQTSGMVTGFILGVLVAKFLLIPLLGRQFGHKKQVEHD